MTRREKHLTNVIRSRGVAVLLILLGVWMVSVAPGISLFSPLSGAALVITLATAAVMISANRQFNLLRSTSLFYAGLFVFSCAATPSLFNTGLVPPLLAMTVMAAMWIMFTIYNERRSDRRIFIIFAMLSAGAVLDWTFLFFIPVFIAGIGQMRILRPKKIIAALIGILTPWWIVLGLGIIPIPSVPRIFFTPPSLLLDTPGIWPFLATVAFTVTIGFFTGSLSLIRILGFNARARAVNGFLALIGIATGSLAIVNFTNFTTYVVLLNACVAFQVGHFFRATASRRGYIFMLSLIAGYAGLYIWGILS